MQAWTSAFMMYVTIYEYQFSIRMRVVRRGVYRMKAFLDIEIYVNTL